jgi:hypothetical protein
MKLKDVLGSKSISLSSLRAIYCMTIMAALTMEFFPANAATDTVQINVKSILISRAVTTYSNGKL